MTFRRPVFSVVAGIGLALALSAIQAQPRFMMKGERGKGLGREPEPIEVSRFRAVFAEPARCPAIASPFGSRTRYDGSLRPPSENGGYHGGVDISLDEGTPLLAVASGTVLSKGQGGMQEGIYLWLRHAPEDTGLAYWVFSKYQHLESMPDLEAGAKVAMGQVVARSGKTGTVGKYYGMSGYPHLHLTTRKVASGAEPRGPLAARLSDPVAIYYDAGAKSRDASEAPQATEVSIPYVSSDGKVTPPGTRVVWPVACRTK